MKNKSDLKRKVLCSLLAASTMGIFYSSDALAASVNGVNPDLDNDGIITDAELIGLKDSEGNNVGSKKFVIVQGDKLVIATEGNVNSLIKDIQAANGDLNAIRKAIADHSVVGVIGGEGQLDDGLTGLLGNSLVSGLVNQKLPGVIDKVQNIDTTGEKNDVVKIGDTYLQIGIGEGNSPVVIGAVGGDLSINTGINLDVLGGGSYEAQPTTIKRNGNVNTVIESGNVLGGIGGSAAVTVGNIRLDFAYGGILPVISGELNGQTVTTINGNVNTFVNNGANIGAFANGGGAIALGGEATSTVNGSTMLDINSNVNIKNGMDGITAGVAGGGLAVSTFGGTAESMVNGTANISITDGLAAGVVGGGVAVSADAAGLLNKGNNDSTITVTDEQIQDLLNMPSGIPDGAITVNSAIEGGTAKANVQDTAIKLEGNTVAGGIIGGGLAVASHNYAVRENCGEAPEGYKVGDPLGSSYAESNIGTSNIHINLDSETLLNGNVSFSDVKNNLLNGDKNTGIAVGVFGGGAAAAVGDANSKAVANADAVNMYVENGYVAGAFGNGLALSVYDKGTDKTDADSTLTAKSETTGDINITVDKGAKVVGLFGNGLAAGIETTINTNNTDADKNTANGKNPNAEVVANNTNINVLGAVDGIIGGGLIIANGYYHGDKSVVVDTQGTSTINIYDGSTIDKFSYGSLNNALNALKDFEIGGQHITQLGDLIGEKLNYYVTDLGEAAGDAAIIGGAVAVGQGGYGHVHESVINVMGGEVKGDIIAGGIASVTNVDTSSGVVVDESTINLVAGTVDGDIYAGGVKNSGAYDVTNVYTSKAAAESSVKYSVINLGDTDVAGVISGKGYEYTSAGAKEDYKVDGDVSKLNLVGSGETALTLVDNDSKIKNFDFINATAGSVTKVEDLNNTTALIDAEDTTVTVADNAKLDINELKVGNTYKVISNTDETDKAWTDSNLVYDRTAGYAAGTEVASGNYDINYKALDQLTEEEQDKAVNDFVDSIGEGGDNFEGTANGIIRNGENTNAGAKDFFGDYTKGEGTSRDLAAMAMIGEAAGVTSNTIDVAGDMADNSVLRLSFTQDDITGEPKVNEDGAIWAKYIHNKHDLDGMDSSFGDINSSSDFDGATIGVDFAKKGKVQSGIAFSYGSGDSHGMGINNDFDMWGVSLYGNVKNDDTNVIADIGFSESDNELTGTAMGKDIKADRDVSVFTVGVRAEKLYTNGSTQIVPYTGLRYYNVDPDSYTAYYDGQKFGEYDADRQNIWTLPVGVSLRNETVTESGWRLTPKVDVAYIWAFGDTDNSFDLNTGSGVDTLDYTVMDSGSWLGSVGFEAGKDDWAFGVGYSYQKGSHEEANKWFVNVEYSF